MVNFTTIFAVLPIRCGEIILLILLGIAMIGSMVSTPAAHLGSHRNILMIFLASLPVLLVSARFFRFHLLETVRIIYTIIILFSLYKICGELGFDLHGRGYDAPLIAIDTWLFGFDPALGIASYITPAGVEFLSAIYMLFIAYVYLSLAINCFGRSLYERELFFCGLTTLYCLGYVGYLLLPAQGPIGFHADVFAAPLVGGPMYDFMMEMVAAQGGAVGAFPSLHVGGAAYLCLFDIRRDPMRCMTYIPIVALIALSTIYLRFHYVIDWVGGIGLAIAILWFQQRAIRGWWQRVEH